MWCVYTVKLHSFVQVVITLYGAWAREVTVNAGIYGEAVCPLCHSVQQLHLKFVALYL